MEDGECFRDAYSPYYGVFIVSLIILLVLLILVVLMLVMMVTKFRKEKKAEEDEPVTGERMVKERMNENMEKDHM